MNRPAHKAAAKQRPTLVGFTQLEVPHIELYETAVAFEAQCDPITAHDRLRLVFGQKAGAGSFLFRADSSVAGRFWVRSTVPWSGTPSGAIALEPKRVVLQLADGLMYHFALPVCVGHEVYQSEEKLVHPFRTAAEFEAWFSASAPGFGIKPLMFSASLRSLRFRHEGVPYRIDHAMIEGALEVADPDRLKQRVQRGFGSHRRAGLGLLHLYN
ncbi:MAG TPA: type I-E CRISPR-associated protein Cas6/Cse3/CasE [Burkholderiaceae bacterium]|jgi:CRISPR-associated protein Cas6/Cse3/CasE subtype I-E